MTKYHAKKVRDGGYVFDSMAEMRRWSAAWKKAAKLFYHRYIDTYKLMMEARAVARRLLKERDEAFEDIKSFNVVYLKIANDNLDLQRERDEARAAIEALNATIRHLESDRDALAGNSDLTIAYEKKLIAEYTELRERNKALTVVCTSIDKERLELRECIEKVEWEYAYRRLYCAWCGFPKERGHSPSCARQKALGLAK